MKQTFFNTIVLLTLVLCSACTSKTNSKSFAEARSAFKTQISYSVSSSSPPIPPASVFLKVAYPSAVGPLAAYLTPDPKDSSKHPAIIWITGGDSNSIDNLWTPSPPSNDQTAAAYRNAGIVMMFPSLRGGNDNPGNHEGFYGEVDDILAAFDYLSKQTYVDPDRIYLGGHSTGGTLALLTAELRNPFRAVFAFGPVGSITSYNKEIIPIDFSKYEDLEVRLRSPGYWLDSARGQVFVIEGENMPGNIETLNVMKKVSKNPDVHFIAVRGANHFSVLAPSNQMIASTIIKDGPSKKVFEMTEMDFRN